MTSEDRCWPKEANRWWARRVGDCCSMEQSGDCCEERTASSTGGSPARTRRRRQQQQVKVATNDCRNSTSQNKFRPSASSSSSSASSERVDLVDDSSLLLTPLLSNAANRFLIDTCNLLPVRSRQTRNRAKLSPLAAPTSTPAALSMLLIVSLIVVLITTTQFQLANSSMCQHHQAMLDLAAAATLQQSSAGVPPSSTIPQQQQAALSSANSNNNNQNPNKAPFETQNLVVCPKSSQYNNLPQFPSRYISPSLERQQREILKHLNASFANHMQLAGANQPVSVLASADYPDSGLPSELIDDELLNEIISPLVVDAAYERAKELIVKRRKLENELVRQGKY